MKLALFSMLFMVCLYPQVEDSTNNWKVIKTIKKKAESISTDRLGNFYLISTNDIWLYNNKGDSIAAFNSRKYGDISHVDTTDPYKILVFFRDYGLILFLDNYLSENGEAIDLQELGYDQVTMACQSRETGFWIYDQLKQKAFHLNDNFKQIHETVNLSQWFQRRIMPSGMIEFNNQLFLNEKESGIYVFDHFATYLKRIAIKEVDRVQLLENRINYVRDNTFCEYEIKSFDTNCKELPKSEVIDARVEKNRFYLMRKDYSIIYQTN